MAEPPPPSFVVRKIDIDALGVSGLADYGRISVTIGERDVSLRLDSDQIDRLTAEARLIAVEILRVLLDLPPAAVEPDAGPRANE